MIKIKLTWPALILLLIALLVWLARDPGARKPAPKHRTAPWPASQPRGPIIIEQPPAGDYAAETERLDREAAESAHKVFEESARQNQTIIEELNNRNEQRRHRYARR